MHKIKVLILILVCGSALVTQAHAIPSAAEGESILSCQGTRKGSYDPIDFFGPTIQLEVRQTPQSQDYSWVLSVSGKNQVEDKSNGPINADGTTNAANGDEGMVMYRGPGQGFTLKLQDGSLQGNFNYIEHIKIDLGDEYYLVEYDLSACKLTGVPIDQREANMYGAKAELADQIFAANPSWLLGAGVRINNTGHAIGIEVFARDEQQKSDFIAEFDKRGLLVVAGSEAKAYKFKKADGSIQEVPLEFTITGDIGPNP